MQSNEVQVDAPNFLLNRLGTPYHGFVIKGDLIYAGARVWSDFPIDPGGPNVLLETIGDPELLENDHDDLIDMADENGWDWKDRFLLPHSLKTSMKHWIYIDDNDTAWELELTAEDVGIDGDHIEYTVWLEKRWGLFETVPGPTYTGTEVGTHTQDYSPWFGPGSLADQDDPVGIAEVVSNSFQIEQNPRGNKIFIMQYCSFNPSLSWQWEDRGEVVTLGLTSPIMKRPTFGTGRALAGIIELTVTGSVDPATGEGLNISAVLWKNGEDCSSLMEFTFNDEQHPATGWNSKQTDTVCTPEMTYPTGDCSSFSSTYDRTRTWDEYLGTWPIDNQGNGQIDNIIWAYYDQAGTPHALGINYDDDIYILYENHSDRSSWQADTGNWTKYDDPNPGCWGDYTFTTSSGDAIHSWTTNYYKSITITGLLIDGVQKQEGKVELTKNLYWERTDSSSGSDGGVLNNTQHRCENSSSSTEEAWSKRIGTMEDTAEYLYEHGNEEGVVFTDSSSLTVDGVPQYLDDHYGPDTNYGIFNYRPRMLIPRKVGNRLYGYEASKGGHAWAQGIPDYMHLYTDSTQLVGEVQEDGAYDPYTDSIETGTLIENPGFI